MKFNTRIHDIKLKTDSKLQNGVQNQAVLIQECICYACNLANMITVYSWGKTWII